MTSKEFYSFSDLLEIFPFGKTKLRHVIKVGKQYITSKEAIQRWTLENIGKEILF